MEKLLNQKIELENKFKKEFDEDIKKYKYDSNDEYSYKNLLKKQYLDIKQELTILGYEDEEFKKFQKNVDSCISILEGLKNRDKHNRSSNIINTRLLMRTRIEVNKILQECELY